MTYSLLGELSNFSSCEKKAWANYLNGFQDEDGLFRDPVIYGQGWYKDDPLWCGRPHLSCHVLTALACLGSKAAKPLSFLDHYKDIDKLSKWLSGLDFGKMVAYSGNEIMNIGTMLQYSRDFHADDKAGDSAKFLLEWLSSNHINKESGIWGSLDISNPVQRSESVQAAYHWWPLFFYDKFPVPYMETVIDTLLATQNPKGGFGWGVHNPKDPYVSSACEDIDSIDPLVRISAMIPYRRMEVQEVLKRAEAHVFTNQMSDGGFVFYRGRDFQYGHEELSGLSYAGAMFPTWFRTLSLAIIDAYFGEMNKSEPQFTFTDFPGFQFWN